MFFNSIKSISVAEAAERVKNGSGVLVDVRTHAEYAALHAQGARHAPLSSLTPKDVDALKAHPEVYVLCQSGGRSAVATQAFVAAGINAINVSGGTSAWVAHGLPLA